MNCVGQGLQKLRALQGDASDRKHYYATVTGFCTKQTTEHESLWRTNHAHK